MDALITPYIQRGLDNATREGVITEDTVLSLDEDAHYKLGYPMDNEVIHGAILAQARKTHWCSLTQRWVE